MSCGADITANALLTSLIEGKNFDLPDVDLTDPQFQIPDGDRFTDDVDKLTNEDLTTRVVDGSGVFDALMSGLSAHLKKEYEQNRITGEQYTKAYISAVGGALQTGASFLLGRDQAYWQAVLAQQQALMAEVQAVTARVTLETAKATLAEARIRALNAEAEFGLTKMKIASEDQQYCLLVKQTEAAQLQITAAEFNNEHLLPLQKTMLEEQINVQRAQTTDTRSDGTVIVGSVGKQKDLYTQQITSYQRDAEVKASKLFFDAWATRTTVDELTPIPASFSTNALNDVLRNIRANNDIGTDPGEQSGEEPYVPPVTP
jgi:beta-glucosidase-like glycosyl hydrolase